MVVAMGRNHARMLADMGVPPDRLRMMRSFDPRSAAFTLDVEDPYYGGPDDFEAVFAVIEASLPGLHDWIDLDELPEMLDACRKSVFGVQPGEALTDKEAVIYARCPYRLHCPSATRVFTPRPQEITAS